jgi:3-methyl-2-oxobutanoate hydroxymethyltransferase
MADSLTKPERITHPILRRKKQQGEKIAVVTCYDYPSALLVDRAGVDVVLVGDSLGNAVLGYETTVPVTMEEMIHHAKAVVRGIRRALVVADLPFLSYQVSMEDALRNAGRLMKEAGVQAVKLEGGEAVAPTVKRLVTAGIPVMGHVGLTPQSVNQLGGYRIQGRSTADGQRLLNDARTLAEAGAFAVVLELIPAALAGEITAAVPIPTIGIGAGGLCDGQVLVFHDLLGLYPEQDFRHNRRYAEIGCAIREAVSHYVEDVRSGAFPTSEQSY